MGGLAEVGTGLLYAMTGGAKGYGTAVGDQYEDARKAQTKMDEETQMEELRLQREQKILEMRQQFEKDNLPNELEKIKARAKAANEADPAAQALKWAQADKARNDVERDKEARAFEKEIAKQREDLAKAKTLARNDPSLQSLVAARQEKLDTLLGSKPEGTYSVREEYNPDTEERKQITERRGVGAPPVQKSSGVTRAQVDAAAKAKGITDPAKLQELYKTYGV